MNEDQPDRAQLPTGQPAVDVVLSLSEQLSAVSDVEDVAFVVAQAAVQQLGASAGFVAVAAADGATLDMLAHVREGEGVMRRCKLSTDASLPVVDAWRFGVPIYLVDRDEMYSRYPTLDQERSDREALAALPLLVEGDRIGTLNFTFAAPQAFDVDQQATLRAIAALCAQALRRTALLEELERVRTDFVATASHELRTPLAAMYGAALTLHGDLSLTDAQRQELQEVLVDQTERMRAVVDDLQLTTSLDRGQVDLQVGPVDVAATLHSAAVRWMSGSTHRIVLDLAPDLPPVQADPCRLHQIVSNLVDNAHKYAQDDTQIDIRASHNGYGSVCIEVCDRGPGMSEEDRSRAFDKFFRADASHRNGVSGAGLGLYISARLAHAMGGTLELVDHAPGTGLVARLTLFAQE